MDKLLKELEDTKIEGWLNYHITMFGPKRFGCKMSEDQNWMIDCSPFSEKFRLIPNSMQAELKFLNIEDVFEKNESADIQELLKLLDQINKE